MKLNEKIQELRKAKGLTQEELAKALYVSRTAISKWESGRGYPNIESLKQIAKFFGITVDELLSSEELLTVAEENTKQTKTHYRDLIFGLLDVSALALLFLPFFGQRIDGVIQNVSLISLLDISGYMRYAYFDAVISITVFGIVTLALQNLRNPFWLRYKGTISQILSIIATALFIIGQQPYAAFYMFIFLLIKVFVLIKRN